MGLGIIEWYRGWGLAYLVISLALIMRLISSTITELTHTMEPLETIASKFLPRMLTFFANQAIISVVGVVCISRDRASTIANDSEIEF